MATKYSKKRKKTNYYKDLYLQMQFIKKMFNVVECTVSRANELVCLLSITPTDLSSEYLIQIRYKPPGNPKVFVLSPDIPYSSCIHMYSKDKSLCLYDHRVAPWKESMKIAGTIIPWIIEWLVFYEYYVKTGVWKGDSADHQGDK
jgi:hypothetical protein